jgi:hypothetical protein
MRAIIGITTTPTKQIKGKKKIFNVPEIKARGVTKMRDIMGLFL